MNGLLRHESRWYELLWAIESAVSQWASRMQLIILHELFFLAQPNEHFYQITASTKRVPSEHDVNVDEKVLADGKKTVICCNAMSDGNNLRKNWENWETYNWELN